MRRDDEEFFKELYADNLSICPSGFEMCSGRLENGNLPEDSSELDIRPRPRKYKNVLIFDSDNDSDEE